MSQLFKVSMADNSLGQTNVQIQWASSVGLASTELNNPPWLEGL